MNNDYDYIFDMDEFKNIPRETIEGLKQVLVQIEGKTVQEALTIIIRFQASLPKSRQLSRQEQNAMIDVVLKNISEEDRAKFKQIISFLEKQ